MDTNIILIGVGGVVLGLILGYFISKSLAKGNASKMIEDAKKEANVIIKEASEGESLRKEKELKAKV